MKFRSDDTSIQDAYSKKRHLTIVREFKPASAVCDSCWGRNRCMGLIARGSHPNTCCVWSFFDQTRSSSVETMIQYTCENKCVSRQKWEYDPTPHNAEYCQDHCPVSRYLRDQGPSSYQE